MDSMRYRMLARKTLVLAKYGHSHIKCIVIISLF